MGNSPERQPEPTRQPEPDYPDPVPEIEEPGPSPIKEHVTDPDSHLDGELTDAELERPVSLEERHGHSPGVAESPEERNDPAAPGNQEVS